VGIIEIGKELLAVKEARERGQFGPWLEAEFGWGDRIAQKFMRVAEKLKTEKFALLAMQPSAVYLLTAPSAREALDKAVVKAKAGEEITHAAAKEIVAEVRKEKQPRKQKTVPAEKLAGPLTKVLERFRDRCDPTDRPEMGRQLRDFAATLDGQKRVKKPAKGHRSKPGNTLPFAPKRSV
jgi:hypothetical protein